MVNRYSGNLGPAPAARSAAPKGGGKKIGVPFNEKPGFPDARLPGKTQGDCSLGVKKLKVHAKSVGV